MTLCSVRFNQVGYNYFCHLVREPNDFEQSPDFCSPHKTHYTEAFFLTYPHLRNPINKIGTYTLYFFDIYHNPVNCTGNTCFSVTHLDLRETAYLRFQTKFNYQDSTTTFSFYLERIEEIER